MKGSPFGVGRTPDYLNSLRPQPRASTESRGDEGAAILSMWPAQWSMIGVQLSGLRGGQVLAEEQVLRIAQSALISESFPHNPAAPRKVRQGPAAAQGRACWNRFAVSSCFQQPY